MLSYTSLQATFMLQNSVGENTNEDDNSNNDRLHLNKKKYILVNGNDINGP